MSASNNILTRLNRPARARANTLEGECPPPPRPDPMESAKNSLKLAEQMGLGTCRTDKKVRDVHVNATMGRINTLFGSAQGPTIDTNVKVSNDASVGCENLVMMEDQKRIATHSVSCILNKSKASYEASVSAGQKVKIAAINGGKLKMKCGNEGLRISQDMKVKLLAVNQLTEEEMIQIGKEVDNAIKNTADFSQKNETGVGASSQGGKILKNSMTDVSNQSFNSTATEKIKSFKVSGGGTQDIELIADGGEIEIEGEACEFKQNSVIDIVAQNVVDQSFKAAFSETYKTIAEEDTKISQTAKAAGLEALKGGGIMQIIGGIIGLLVIIALLYLGYKMITKDENKKKKKGKKGKKGKKKSSKQRSASSGYAGYGGY